MDSFIKFADTVINYVLAVSLTLIVIGIPITIGWIYNNYRTHNKGRVYVEEPQ